MVTWIVSDTVPGYLRLNKNAVRAPHRKWRTEEESEAILVNEPDAYHNHDNSERHASGHAEKSARDPPPPRSARFFRRCDGLGSRD